LIDGTFSITRLRRAAIAVPAALAALTSLLVLLASPAPAVAVVPSGALSQLASPFECVGESEEEPKAPCGTTVAGGTKFAYQSQVSPDGKNVYSVSITGDLVEYSRNLASGALTVIGCIAGAPSGTKCAPENETRGIASIDAPTALAISSTGEDVYVGGQTNGAVLALGRDPETGLLSVLKGTKGETACVEAGSTGECEQKNAKGLGSPYGVAVSADGKSVYVTSVGGESIAELERNVEAGPLLGQLTPIAGHECIGGAGSACPDKSKPLVEPIGVVVSADGEDVYVAAGASGEKGEIAAFERNKATGVLTQLEKEKGCVSEKIAGCTTIRALQGSEDLAITTDGKFVYAPSQSNNALVVLKREAGGELKQLAKEAGCMSNQAITECKLIPTSETRIGGSRGVALSPGPGADLYASSANEDAVSEFSRNEATGEIKPFEKPYECVTTALEGPEQCGEPGIGSFGLVGLEGARRLVVSPDGTNVYIAAQGGNDVVELARTVLPTVKEASPVEGSEAGGQEVTIEGEGFREGAQVLFGVVPAVSVTVNSATSITAVSPAESEGTASIFVKDSVGQSAKAAGAEFKVKVAAMPTVTGVSSTFGPQRGGSSVNISGTEFLAGATVRFGGTAATNIVVNSGASITATSPPGSGVQDVTVTTSKGTSAASSADHFKYNFRPPKELGGLNTSGYCVHLGDIGKAGAPAKLLRGAVEGPNFAFENWACETSAGALIPIAATGPAPSEEDMCHFEYPSVPSFAFAEEVNSAFSWACFEAQPSPAPGPGPAKAATTKPVQVPAPVLARTGNVAPVSGTVLVRLPRSKKFVSLTTLTSIPFGTVINATNGRVVVTTAAPHGGTQTGEFFEGEFILSQGANGVVVAALTGGNFSVCPTAKERAHKASAQASAKRGSGKHVVRKLWANAHGSFSTRGNYAAGAVAGTEWLTEDLCEGTLIRVTRDKVRVTNLVRHRSKLVLAGHSLLAKAP
jgi:DNA-binding beta-propeller fold protein YncE